MASKQIKEPRLIEILVNIKYVDIDNKTKQIFEFVTSNKKNLSYLFDARYLFKNKIDNLLKEMSLKDYISRTDSDTEIVVEYEKQEHPNPCIRKIVSVVPPNNGCKYCTKAQTKGDGFIYCPEKNKTFFKSAEGIQRCPVFRCKEIILT